MDSSSAVVMVKGHYRDRSTFLWQVPKGDYEWASHHTRPLIRVI
jgi:hypothetical protein